MVARERGGQLRCFSPLRRRYSTHGLERVSCGIDKEEAAVDPGVLNVLFPHGGELLPKVGRVLVLDVPERRARREGESDGQSFTCSSTQVF